MRFERGWFFCFSWKEQYVCVGRGAKSFGTCSDNLCDPRFPDWRYAPKVASAECNKDSLAALGICIKFHCRSYTYFPLHIVAHSHSRSSKQCKIRLSLLHCGQLNTLSHVLGQVFYQICISLLSIKRNKKIGWTFIHSNLSNCFKLKKEIKKSGFRVQTCNTHIRFNHFVCSFFFLEIIYRKTEKLNIVSKICLLKFGQCEDISRKWGVFPQVK